MPRRFARRSKSLSGRFRKSSDASAVSYGHDIPVPDDVFFPLEPPPAGLFDPGERSILGEEIFIADHFRAYERRDEVGVDHSRRLLGGCPPPDRPCPAFVFPHGEKRLEPEE